MNIQEKLNKSPINYFSDLFIVAMVLAWIIECVIMTTMAIYSTVVFNDTSMWSDVGVLVGLPLTAGGAIWMIKNSVQHAIAYKQGKRACMDFPAVNAEGQNDGIEEPFQIEKPIEEDMRGE